LPGAIKVFAGCVLLIEVKALQIGVAFPVYDRISIVEPIGKELLKLFGAEWLVKAPAVLGVYELFAIVPQWQHM